MVGNNKNIIQPNTYSIIFTCSFILVLIQIVAGESFGFLSFLSWIVVLVGIGSFVHTALFN